MFGLFILFLDQNDLGQFYD